MTNQSPNMSSPAELLHWYKHAGVDIALEDAPIDHFAEFKRQIKEHKTARATSKPKVAAPIIKQMADAAIPDESVIANARELAKSAKSLEELREILNQFKGCNLRLSAKNLIFADGNPQAEIMLVGEAPDRDEDMHGLPFVGRSGQLLDKMLEAIQLDRETVYLTNVIPWRPPGNRTPTPAEIEICRPFIARHIELVNPKVLVLLGDLPTRTLLNASEGIFKLRGRWKKYKIPNNDINCLPILHPAYLVKHSAQKRLAWQDLLKVKGELG